jgi:hypothetical protein
VVEVKSRVPPNYVNARSDVIYSHDISDGVARTYICLAGLAWQDNQHKHLPELTGDELCQTLNCKRSTLMGHLKKLRSLGFIKWNSKGGRFQIQIIPKIQSFGFSLNDDVDTKYLSKSKKVLTTTKKIQNSGFASQEEKNLAVLKSFGVDISSQEAIQIASMPGIEPGFIQTWGDYMVDQYPQKDISDFLLYKLAKTRTLPNEENRGGSRKKKVERKSQEAIQTQFSQESISKLPASVKADLIEISWADSEIKIEQAYEENSELVLAWLEYTKNLPEKEIRKSRAGLFRHGIRTGKFPPKPKSPSHKKYSAFLENESGALVSEEEKDHTESETRKSVNPELDGIWNSVLSQLKLDMPPHTFALRVEKTYPISLQDEVLKIQAENTDSQEWLEDHLSTSAENLLVGVLKKRVAVEFAAEGA